MKCVKCGTCYQRVSGRICWEKHQLCGTCYYGRKYDSRHKNKQKRNSLPQKCKKCNKIKRCGTYNGHYPRCWTRAGLCGECYKPIMVKQYGTRMQKYM